MWDVGAARVDGGAGDEGWARGSEGTDARAQGQPPDTHSQKSVSKETYYSVKRDLLQCQKRPTSVKRDLLQCQKRPNTVSKETYAAHLTHILKKSVP
jgi:hypothetical protein